MGSASAAPPLTCKNGWWGRSWDQVGGEKRAPDLVPLPRQDQEVEQDNGGAAEADEEHAGSSEWVIQ